MDIDYTIRKDKPSAITATSTPDAVDFYEKWKMSNCLSVTFIKIIIFAGIRGSIYQHDKVKDLLKAINGQFTTSDKSLANTLIMQFSSIKLTRIREVHDHIICIRDIVAQLKALEVTIFDSFLVHYILCTLPHQYAPFKISYNTDTNKWSINELLTMCAQEEERLLIEEGESVNLTTSTRSKTNQVNHKGKISIQSDIKKEPKCFFCKKKGHIKKDCLKFKT
ncbi:uncharacterized protein LOC113852052 [Abrus precatorius]|uniref:Uncharacterized protein LOC113852052 n=1 Tax=Abrus precatorius TaxID=3816 RepID=A0A8B8K371_ABRPR|nr:uncharacterized protein LOC113852052 [Abrus precatorius]